MKSSKRKNNRPAARMPLLRMVILVCVTVALSVPAAAEEPGKKVPAQSNTAIANQRQPRADETACFPASYVELYRQILATYRGRAEGGFGTKAALADVALRLWKQTGDPALREEALDYFSGCLADPRFNLKDFHVLHHFGELVARMKEAKILLPDPRRRPGLVGDS